MRHNPIIEGMPTGGIWYCVYLQGLQSPWVLATSFEERDQHICMWPERILPMLVSHYNLTKKEAAPLYAKYAALPRGRVVSYDYGHQVMGITHGGDFPSGITLMDIKRVFNLELCRVSKPVIHEHEKMLPQHKKILQSVLGIKIPYRSRSTK